MKNTEAIDVPYSHPDMEAVRKRFVKIIEEEYVKKGLGVREYLLSLGDFREEPDEGRYADSYMKQLARKTNEFEDFKQKVLDVVDDDNLKKYVYDCLTQYNAVCSCDDARGTIDPYTEARSHYHHCKLYLITEAMRILTKHQKIKLGLDKKVKQ